MRIEWSGLGPELLVRLDRSAGQPLRAQLEAFLREAIRTGRLREGERLPSSRVLAGELGVSRGLVQECYAQLLAEGYLTSRGGSATRVAGVGDRALAVPPPVPRGTPPRLIADFRPGISDLASFPRTDWAWAMRETCSRIASADLDYGDPRGSIVLRDVLAAYLSRVRAADAEPGRIVVSAGFAQGVSLVLRALAREAGVRRVAFEDPGYGRAATDETLRAVAAMGLHLAHIPVDAEGVVVSALAASGAQAVVVTPAHQSPTGVVLSASRRHALLDWARRGDGYVIEDDYDSEFRYDKEPVGALQGLAPDRVFLAGTASKSLAPAVRLGWVLAPAALAGAVAAEKEMSDRGSSALDQIALATMLTSGRYDRHLRRMRTVYAARRMALVAAFARHAPAVRLTGLAAGFHAVARLSDGADEAAVVAAARSRLVGLHGMSDFRAIADPGAPAELVMGFGNVGERAIEPAIAAIADLFL
ncbi:MAG TPA: PLP-dependent aminotransferase family protein [Streptosporangiaceae bacterium]|nr:PLP-dependent aminotransferase family protein [Streptosporangiaceae bacterium]